MTILSSKTRRGINDTIKKYRKELKAKELLLKDLMKLQKAFKSINLEKTLKPMELEKELKRIELQQVAHVNYTKALAISSGDPSLESTEPPLESTELMELLALEKARQKALSPFKSALSSMRLIELLKAVKDLPEVLKSVPKPEETGFWLTLDPNGAVYFGGLTQKAVSVLKEEPVMVNPEILSYLKKKGFHEVYFDSVNGFNQTILLVYP